MSNRTRRTLSNAEVIAYLDRWHPGWRKLPADSPELTNYVRAATGASAYVTYQDRPYFDHADLRPDLGMLRRQLVTERERAHIDALIENLHRDYQSAAQERATARLEARRLRIAGHELEDVTDAAQRVREGRPPISAAEVEERERKRELEHRADIERAYAEDMSERRWHDQEVAELREHLETLETERIRTWAPKAADTMVAVRAAEGEDERRDLARALLDAAVAEGYEESIIEYDRGVFRAPKEVVEHIRVDNARHRLRRLRGK